MNIAEAKAIARAWVVDHAAHEPGFAGAVFHGSVNWAAETAPLPPSSDIDLLLVITELPENRPGKFLYRGVLLEVSYLAEDRLSSPGAVLGQSDLAGSFHVPSVILDPTGRLGAVQAAVAAHYAERRWVNARCEHAWQKALANLDSIARQPTFPVQFTAWLFGTGLTTHVLLAAGLRNPTVRKRYSAVHELLTGLGREDAYEPLLALLGCAAMTRESVERHLVAMTAAFDAAAAVIHSPDPFSTDLTELARPVPVDGSWELIERGEHREAIFWIAATYARCQRVLQRDGSAELAAAHDAGFRALAGELGAGSVAAMLANADRVRAAWPWLQSVAAAIMAGHPEIVD